MSDIITDNEILNKKTDKKICRALMAIFIILMVQYSLLIYFNFYENINASGAKVLSSDALKIQLFSKSMVGLMFLYALPAVFKRSIRKLFLVYSFALFIFLVHYMIFVENRPHIQGLIFPFFFICIPAFVYTLSIRDLCELKHTMKKASNLIFLMGVILGGLVFLGRSSMGPYSMSFSYYMLLPTIMFMDELFSKFTLKTFFFMVISLSLILALGSRGAILCSIVFCVFRSIRLRNRINKKRALVFFAFLYSTIIGVVFF